NMVHERVTVSSNDEVADGLYVFRFRSETIAGATLPGQFVNIRTADGFVPFLRRPFSVSRVDRGVVEILFNVVGRGTAVLASKRPGDELDVLGPLGKPFGFRGDFEHALIVAGGLGVAPFPILTDWLQRDEKQVESFIGARSAYQLYRMQLKNLHVATDDGSAGFQGTVVQLLEQYLRSHTLPKPKIFGCGPTNMMKALSGLARNMNIDCELSLEGDMACGIGLCQGCPVETVGGTKKYALVCKDGPAFKSHDIVFA
ncbi:MAG: dihydroorotate dehydrogenase electron transfer subunit, partial [Bacteroidota bacterium]